MSFPGFSEQKGFWALFFVTLLALMLRFFNFADLGIGNLFYASTIRSMGESWHNFFYASFDPSGTIAVDKPPLGLWLQVLSTKLFGLNAFGFIGPIALAGALAVPLVFVGAYRWFGLEVATIAAIVLAIFPESVATSRDSTMDALLMFVAMLSALILVYSVENRPKLLLIWAVSLAVLFNIKFFEGLIFLPAAGVYIMVRWRNQLAEKAGLIFGSGIIFIVCASLWMVAVELTNVDSRPLILNDPNNSPFSLAIFYNGIERVFPSEVTIFQPIPDAPRYSAALQAIWAPAFGVGDAGLFRLFSGANGPLLGSTLCFGLFGVLSILVAKRSLLNGPVLFWMTWFLTGLVLFSFSNRAPAHYIESFAPAIAIMGGLGIVRGLEYFGVFKILIAPLIFVCLLLYNFAVTTEYPVLREMLAYALAGGIIVYILFGLLRTMTNLKIAMPILSIFLFFPLLTSAWIVSFSPRAQITQPNPVIYATEEFAWNTSSQNQSWRRVPAEKFLEKLPVDSSAKYRFGIDGMNNAGEAIAFTGEPILPVWNEYRRELMFPPDVLRGFLDTGELQYLVLSQGRIALGLLDEIRDMTGEYCEYDEVLSADFKSWVVFECGR